VHEGQQRGLQGGQVVEVWRVCHVQPLYQPVGQISSQLVELQPANGIHLLYVSESDILGPIDYLSDIENWYHLKGLCLKITVLNIKRKYSYYSCQYQHFEMHALSIMNSVYVKYRGVRFLLIHLWSNY